MAKTSAQVMELEKNRFQEAVQRHKELVKTYKEEPRVATYLAPTYANFLGKVMTVSINGISIYFPVDGQTYNIPQTFADEVASRRKSIDAIISKQHKASRIVENVETSPGEMVLF